MTSATQWPRVTREEYLAADRAIEYKSEYIDGYVLAICDASRQHTIPTVSIAALLHADLIDSPCKVHARIRRHASTMSHRYFVGSCGVDKLPSRPH